MSTRVLLLTALALLTLLTTPCVGSWVHLQRFSGSGSCTATPGTSAWGMGEWWKEGWCHLHTATARYSRMECLRGPSLDAEAEEGVVIYAVRLWRACTDGWCSEECVSYTLWDEGAAARTLDMDVFAESGDRVALVPPPRSLGSPEWIGRTGDCLVDRGVYGIDGDPFESFVVHGCGDIPRSLAGTPVSARYPSSNCDGNPVVYRNISCFSAAGEMLATRCRTTPSGDAAVEFIAPCDDSCGSCGTQWVSDYLPMAPTCTSKSPDVTGPDGGFFVVSDVNQCTIAELSSARALAPHLALISITLFLLFVLTQ